MREKPPILEGENPTKIIATLGPATDDDAVLRGIVDAGVDLVRLKEIEPDYVAYFLRTRYGWAQIHRLINGVGPANLSFDEICSLRVGMASAETQREISRRHAAEVLPLQDRGEFAAAAERVRGVLIDLERGIREQGAQQ